MMKYILIFFILINVNIRGSEQIYLQYCFENSSSAKAAIKKVEFLKTSTDYIGQDDKCLDITTVENRRALYNKVMRTKFGITTSPLLASSTQGLCHFKVSRIKTNRLKKVHVNANLQNVKAYQSNTTGNSKSISSLSVSENKPATLTVKGHALKLICSKSGNGYNVEISLAGTEGSLKTSRFITSGTSIELGSISEILNNNQSSKDIHTGIGIRNAQSEEQEDVFLSLK